MDTLKRILEYYDVDVYRDRWSGVTRYIVRIWDQGEPIVESAHQDLEQALATGLGKMFLHMREQEA